MAPQDISAALINQKLGKIGAEQLPQEIEGLGMI
jgi:hypothetical protein